MYADEETDARLLSYGIAGCDCPHPGVNWEAANLHLAENYALNDEGRVPCGCGQESIYFFDLGETLHFEGKHWQVSCLMIELADRLFKEKI